MDKKEFLSTDTRASLLMDLESQPMTWDSQRAESRLWLGVGEGPIRVKVKMVSQKEMSWLETRAWHNHHSADAGTRRDGKSVEENEGLRCSRCLSNG